MEVLVVLGIITTIISFSFSSFTTAQKKARDTKRKNDLRNIQNYLEQYYSVCNFSYPLSNGNLPARLQAKLSDGCLYDGPIFNIPKDPLGKDYQCVDNCNQEQYTICPPNLGGGLLLELENCNLTNKSCCLKNQQ